MMPRQITFRAEPEITDQWSRFVKDSLILQRCHLTCAVLLYMWSSAETRAVAQKAYARFRREGHLVRPAELDEQTGLSDSESHLLAAYRHASADARQEALGMLERGASPTATETGEPAAQSDSAGRG